LLIYWLLKTCGRRRCDGRFCKQIAFAFAQNFEGLRLRRVISPWGAAAPVSWIVVKRQRRQISTLFQGKSDAFARRGKSNGVLTPDGRCARVGSVRAWVLALRRCEGESVEIWGGKPEN
jgi:hypothetical protein